MKTLFFAGTTILTFAFGTTATSGEINVGADLGASIGGSSSASASAGASVGGGSAQASVGASVGGTGGDLNIGVGKSKKSAGQSGTTPAQERDRLEAKFAKLIGMELWSRDGARLGVVTGVLSDEPGHLQVSVLPDLRLPVPQQMVVLRIDKRPTWEERLILRMKALNFVRQITQRG